MSAYASPFTRFWERQCPILGANLEATPFRARPELPDIDWASGKGLWHGVRMFI
jgi:hypothetical protein